GGDTYLLGEVDPLDAAVAGVPAAAVPRRPPPGRAVRVADAREVQVVSRPRAEPTGVADPARAPSGPGPWRYRPLPRQVLLAEVDRAGRPGIRLGLRGPRAEPWSWRPELDGRRLLVAGPPGSGRTNLLKVLAAGARSASIPVVVVSATRSDWDGSPHRVLAPDDADALVTARHAHASLVVLVDDVDRLDDAPVAPVLREIAELVDRDHGAVVAATSVSSLPLRFRGLDVEIARHRTGVLLRPRPGDGDSLGIRTPRVARDAPGRGVVVVDGAATEVLVALVGNCPDREPVTSDRHAPTVDVVDRR
ncbi:MAG: AAA family ATPase, partial [Phycicoccus sp.]